MCLRQIIFEKNNSKPTRTEFSKWMKGFSWPFYSCLTILLNVVLSLFEIVEDAAGPRAMFVLEIQKLYTTHCNLRLNNDSWNCSSQQNVFFKYSTFQTIKFGENMSTFFRKRVEFSLKLFKIIHVNSHDDLTDSHTIMNSTASFQP